MNAKQKGTRRERQARDILERDGFATTRAAASLGLWDLVAIRRDPAPDDYLPVCRLVQVKSNRWPRTPARRALETDAQRYTRLFVSCEVWRFDDGDRHPRIRILNDAG